MLGLIDTATVYTRGATGAYDVVARSDLKCRLVAEPAPQTAELAERAEQTERRKLLFDPEYSMPEYAQLEIDGNRWNVVAGSLSAHRYPSGSVAYRRCYVVRAR